VEYNESSYDPFAVFAGVTLDDISI
jgi:hypothetical protein